VEAIETTGLQPVIDRHFPLEELAMALTLQKAGGHFGKIVIDIV
jgi:NADPH:quinone reductase-like Zn-dependent oxidoreductase